MTNLDSILKSRDITLPTKVRLVKAIVFPVVIYGCESWTVKKAECWRIDAFELWCWRRPEKAMAPHSSTLAWRIPWTEEPGGLQSKRSLRVRNDWATSLSFSTFHFHALEKTMAIHSSVLAWRIPGVGEPGGLLSMGSHRVGHDWSDLAAAAHPYMTTGKTIALTRWTLVCFWIYYLGWSQLFFQGVSVL